MVEFQTEPRGGRPFGTEAATRAPVPHEPDRAAIALGNYTRELGHFREAMAEAVRARDLLLGAAADLAIHGIRVTLDLDKESRYVLDCGRGEPFWDRPS